MPLLWILLGLGAAVAVAAKASAQESQEYSGQVQQKSPGAPSTTPSGAPAVQPETEWFVPAVVDPSGTQKSERESMIVRVLNQVSSSKKPLLVSFFLRRKSAPQQKAMGDDELLAYGLVRKVSGNGEDRTYETTITSYGRYTPSGPAAGTPPMDAPAVGSVFVLKGNDLASISEYGDSKPAATTPSAEVAKPSDSEIAKQCKRAVEAISSVKLVLDVAAKLGVKLPGAEEIDAVVSSLKSLLEKADAKREDLESKLSFIKDIKSNLDYVPFSDSQKRDVQGAIDCIQNVMKQRFGG